MDKQLLNALDNLSVALEKISETLKKGGAKSPTAKTLESSDMGAKLSEINKGIKKLQDDNKKIIKNQETILSISKKKESDKKTSAFEEAGGDKKQESNIKKGVSVILLIAVAVLAIGLAFKLIGKIDFLSVVGLSLAILLISIAFEKVAKMGMSPMEAAKTAFVMVIMAAAITVSSWVMALIIPISIAQGLTAIFISLTFAFISQNMKELMIGAVVFKRFRVSAFDLMKMMVGIAIAITASSWVFKMLSPISFAQGLTAIFISVVFAIISYNLHKIAMGLVAFKLTGVSSKDMIVSLVAISVAITASSWILKMISPLSFMQLVTAVFISAMFMLISFNLERIAIGVIAFKKTKVSPVNLILVLVGIATAITISSWILNELKPLSFRKIITALIITLMFAAISYVMVDLAIGVAIIDRVLGKNKMFLIPLLFLTISMAITASSWILSMVTPIPFMTLLNILVMSIVVGIAALIFGFVALILIKVIGLKTIFQGSIAIIIIASTIALASNILREGDYSVYPDWKWSLYTAIAVLAYGISAWILNKLGSPVDYLKGGISVIIVAAVIVATSLILSYGDYDEGKSPGLMWTLNTIVSLIAFSIVIIALGIVAMSGVGLAAIAAGALVVLGVSIVIVATSLILGYGDYDEGKTPGLMWTLDVVTAITAFSIMSIALGIVAMSGIGLIAIAAGAFIILGLSATIMETSKILSSGDYKQGPGMDWALSTILLLGAFSTIALALGLVSITGIGFIAILAGLEVSLLIAQAIVDISKILSGGDFSAGDDMLPWAKAVSLLYLTFTPIILVLGAMGIMSSLMSIFPGPSPFESAKSMLVGIADTIVAVSQAFSGATWTGGPPDDWARGVSRSISAFSNVYFKLNENQGIISSIFGGNSSEDFANAIRTIAQGIVDAGLFFNEAGLDVWKGAPTYEWAHGTGEAIRAFAPVLKFLGENSGWFDVDMDDVKEAMIVTAQGIVEVAKYFNENQVPFTGNYPSEKWGKGVGSAMQGFAEVYNLLYDAGWDSDDLIEWRPSIYHILNDIIITAGIFTKMKDKGLRWVFPSSKNTKSLVESLESMISLYTYMDDSGLDPEDVIDYSLSTLNVVGSMVRIAITVNKAKNLWKTQIDPTFMDNLKANVMSYVELAKFVDGEYPAKTGGVVGAIGSMLFGAESQEDPMSRVIDGMIKLGEAYVKLSESIKTFGNAINTLDPEKLAAVKAFTSNVVLMSLMDADMFEDMLDRLEEKSGVLMESINGLEESDKKAEKKSLPKVAPGKAAPKQADPTQQQILKALSSMDAKLGTIAKNTGTLADYANELRTSSGVKLKK